MKTIERLMVLFLLVTALFIFLYSYYHSAGQVKPYVEKQGLSNLTLLELKNTPAYKDAPKPKRSSTGIVERIIACESGGRADAKNPNSSAKGLGQFLDSTWHKYSIEHWGDTSRSVLDPMANRELVAWVVDTHGVGDWEESSGCWS